MRIAALSSATGVSVATLKYYLREGLVPPGRATAVNQADYDDSHVRRVRLVRALLELGHLSIADVAAVVAAVDDDDVPIHDAFALAQDAMARPATPAIAPDDPRLAAARAMVDAFVTHHQLRIRPEAAVRDMARDWYFFRALLGDVELVLAKADLTVAGRYSALAGPLHERFFPVIRAEFDLCVEKVLVARGQQVLLEKNDALRRSIRLRNPYVDPMSLLQVELLARWRDGGRADDALFEALVASINGITRGLQDSG